MGLACFLGTASRALCVALEIDLKQFRVLDGKMFFFIQRGASFRKAANMGNTAHAANSINAKTEFPKRE